MMKKIWLSGLMLLAFSSASSADGKYGFAPGGISQCSMWTLLFPISFQIPNDDIPVKFNVIYVEGDGIKGMDEYYDFYKTPYGQSAWPVNPVTSTGDDTPVCTKVNECYNYGPGGVGYGQSDYNNIHAKYGDATKVMTNVPNADTSLTWFYIPVRKLKLLRVELFTPYTGTVAVHQGYVEPVSFEYTATGNSDELRLTDMKSTADNSSFIILPTTFRPTHTLDIQVWLTKTGDTAYQGLTPQAHIDQIQSNDARLQQIPENCK
ncbi:hypothetical protein MXL54_19635 [Enterobacteriaceae bacterium G50]|nr:hypothetical protein [Enterobacteriaceae bacterium G50]